MNQIERLIKSITPDLPYSITDIVEKCNAVGIDFHRRKLLHDLRREKLQGFQIGGRGDWRIEGKDFIDFIIQTKKTNSTK